MVAMPIAVRPMSPAPRHLKVIFPKRRDADETTESGHDVFRIERYQVRTFVAIAIGARQRQIFRANRRRYAAGLRYAQRET